MSSTSSRILREEEHSVVHPYGGAIPRSAIPKARSREAAVPSEKHAPSRDPEFRPGCAKESNTRPTSGASPKERESDESRRRPNFSRSWTGWRNTLAELSSLRSRIRKDAEGDLLKLSISVARRVLHRELTLGSRVDRGLDQDRAGKTAVARPVPRSCASRSGAGDPGFPGALFQFA